MDVGNAIKGFNFVKKFFPHAKMPDHKNESAMGALALIGALDGPLPSDIVTTFDQLGVGIWNGEEIR